MVVKTIYVTRHAFRGSYTLNASTGEYHTNSPSPTNIPTDPPLAAYGVQQSRELATALAKLDPSIDFIYSSPFYRCLQTVEPAVEKLGENVKVRVDNGIGEFYGLAPFHHPSPASLHLLSTKFFASLKINPSYTASLIPPTSGETIAQFHDRVAYSLNHIIAFVDAETEGRDAAILVCTHAATLIAIGRCLTGRMPEDVAEEDFLAPCAGLTKFVRRQSEAKGAAEKKLNAREPDLEWKNGKGVQGPWDLLMNGNCDHLAGGAERSWNFMGEETFGDVESVPLELRAKSEGPKSGGGDDSARDVKLKL
ncbi:MAG: hypothetical protein Q9211_004274 [Gyalolechia sp. 1 TL-2023]